MPRVPTWLGNTMEKVFSNMMPPVIVTEIEYIDLNLKRVRFEGDLSNTKFIPGYVIEFRVNDNDMRHYTPSYYDKEKGICDVIFYLHNKGVGSKWAENLHVGNKTRLMGPSGRLKYSEQSQKHFFFGDETSLGLFKCIKEEVLKNNQEYFCLLELDKDNQHFKELLNFSGGTLDKSLDNHVQKLNDKIQNFSEDFWDIWREAKFYLSGNAKSIQVVRKALINKGANSRQIVTEGYWAPGRKGL